jgi:hypothetical protein
MKGKAMLRPKVIAVTGLFPLVLTLCGPLSLGLALEPLTPSELMAKWKQREAALPKVCLSWRGAVHSTTASGHPNAEKSHATTGFPASLKLKEMNYVYVTTQFHSDRAGKVTTYEIRSSFDSQLLYTVGRQVGYIEKPTGYPESGNLSLEAPHAVFRPFGSGLFDPSEKPIFEEKSETLGGRACFPVVFPRDETYKIRVWVDRETLLPMRIEGERKKIISTAVTIAYRDQPSPESLASWDYAVYGGKGTVSSHAGSVRDVKVTVGCDLADDAFRIVFPRGTEVRDLRNGDPSKPIYLYSQGNGDFIPWAQRPQPRQIGVFAIPLALLVVGGGLFLLFVIRNGYTGFLRNIKEV